jgi:hypothetical protein
LIQGELFGAQPRGACGVKGWLMQKTLAKVIAARSSNDAGGDQAHRIDGRLFRSTAESGKLGKSRAARRLAS